MQSPFLRRTKLVFFSLMFGCRGRWTGLSLAHYVRGRWPPVIVTSGHARVTKDSLPPGVIFMQKPYDPETLTSRIRELAA
jgi:two-component system, response regulator PdtaR